MCGNELDVDGSIEAPAAILHHTTDATLSAFSTYYVYVFQLWLTFSLHLESHCDMRAFQLIGLKKERDKSLWGNSLIAQRIIRLIWGLNLSY